MVAEVGDVVAAVGGGGAVAVGVVVAGKEEDGVRCYFAVVCVREVQEANLRHHSILVLFLPPCAHRTASPA